MNKQHYLPVLLLAICAVILFYPFESTITAQLSNMLKVTLSVYAVLRGLNAVISVAQGTELSIEPMGVGVTLTPGELLDPLNDLIEHVSTILLFASASIGIQKIVLSLSDSDWLRYLLSALAIASVLLIVFNRVTKTQKNTIIKIIVVLSLLRLMVPAMVVSSSLMQSWLEADRQQSVSVLLSTEKEVRQLNQATVKENDSSWFKSMTDINVTALFDALQSKTSDAVTAAVNILAEFLLVFIFIPLVFLAVAYRLIKIKF